MTAERTAQINMWFQQYQQRSAFIEYMQGLDWDMYFAAPSRQRFIDITEYYRNKLIEAGCHCLTLPLHTN